VRRLAEAAEAQDTECTEPVAVRTDEAITVQADEAVEEQGTKAGTNVEVEAEDSFDELEEDQGILTLSSTESKEQGNPVPQPEPQVPNVPQPEIEPLKMSKEAPEPEPFMPQAPKMGRIVQVSATTYVAELGNVPNPEFSGLFDGGKGQYASTEQQRSMLAK
jgi:hypothetical protein